MAGFSGNSRITDQIMEYYTKHGQNRDLEKFLRLRAANTTRSSSDGSIPAATIASEEADRPGGKIGRSMENLSTLKKQEQVEERGRKSAELASASGGSQGKLEAKQKVEAEKEEVVVKETKSEKKSGRNFNFNLESVIEIKLPPVAMVQQQPIVISPPQQGMLAQGPTIHEISTAGTQTMPESKSVEQQTEEPIRPILKLQKNLNPEDTIDTTRDISPVSSVASNRQKLEWDSLGDIGYNSSDKFYFCGAADLNETEKRCLQKYFTKKGLNFDDKVVVVKNMHTPKKDQKQEEGPVEMSKSNLKNKWQDVYQKYKEKYPNPSEISLGLMNPDAHSTPKVVSLQNVPNKAIKSTQTSLVKILTKGIQAKQIVDTSDKQIGTETLTLSTNKTTSACEQVEVAESFEFFSSPPSEHGEEIGRKRAAVVPSSTGNSLKSYSDSSSSQLQQLSSSGDSGSGQSREKYKFEDELRLGLTLYNTICESRSLPARVKQSLIDKIFRKMQKNDPKGRTKEQLLHDCILEKQQQEQLGAGGEEKSSQADTGLSGFEMMVESGKSSSTGKSSRGVDEVVVEIVEHTSGPDRTASSSEDPIIQNLQELSIKSNDSRNPPQKTGTSSEKTFSTHPDSSNHTARKISQQTPISTEKSSHSSDGLTSDERIRQAMQDYLKPMTHSEVDYANQQDLKRGPQSAKERNKLPRRDTASAPSSGDRIFELFRKEKQSQLLKIDKKIEHLKTMKLLLLEEQKTVDEIGVDTRTTYPLEQKTKQPATKTSDEKENIYENTERRPKSAVSVPVYTSVHEETPNVRSSNGTEFTSGSRSESGWNSHYHMKKMIQNRSKLETPSSDESIATFIKTRKDKFIENYERHRMQMFDEQQHIYTKPYSGRQSKVDQYSHPDDKYSIRNISKPKTKLPRSDVFISSDSMSIPAANTLTNTTTHQYDIKSSRASSDCLTINARPVATQTNIGSLMKTKPIFETKSKTSTSVQVPSQAEGCNCACNCPCRHRIPTTTESVTHRTEIIDGTQPKQDKQLQTKPNSIAYVITFQGGGEGRQQQSEKEQVYHRSSSSASSSSETNATDVLPLKEQFRRNRPGTLMRLKERQKCVNELNKLREERNKQRKKLLLLTSDDSLKRSDGKERLPPPPLAQRRIFSSKAIRENTRRQIRNLPEVLRKKEIEKENNFKRKNLILRDKFNRNLQRKVLKGQVDLSNSVRVMRE